ncbi:uncharacterized protein G2W53_006921 [Senna tora]|uniref:Uncharacterized protein n=1 Tax=Senna tora TaxID=362788 RepID=A0A835CDN1_9FABA|nr:uncharacterized protein G2W53_006921 [Senna tora]
MSSETFTICFSSSLVSSASLHNFLTTSSPSPSSSRGCLLPDSSLPSSLLLSLCEEHCGSNGLFISQLQNKKRKVVGPTWEHSPFGIAARRLRNC